MIAPSTLDEDHASCVTTMVCAWWIIDLSRREPHATTSTGRLSNEGCTPITLAAASYSDRDSALYDFDDVMAAHREGELDHTAVAVLTKDADGELQVERHDTTAKHLAWAGAALVVVAPAVGAGLVASAGAGAGAGASSATSTTTSRRRTCRRSARCSSPDSPVSSWLR